jgi:hypothetical protein
MQRTGGRDVLEARKEYSQGKSCRPHLTHSYTNNPPATMLRQCKRLLSKNDLTITILWLSNTLSSFSLFLALSVPWLDTIHWA